MKNEPIRVLRWYKVKKKQNMENILHWEDDVSQLNNERNPEDILVFGRNTKKKQGEQEQKEKRKRFMFEAKEFNLNANSDLSDKQLSERTERNGKSAMETWTVNSDRQKKQSGNCGKTGGNHRIPMGRVKQDLDWKEKTKTKKNEKIKLIRSD